MPVYLSATNSGLPLDSAGRLRINVAPDSVAAGRSTVANGLTLESAGAMRGVLEGAIGGAFVTFQGRDPSNPAGAAGDWAALNALLRSYAFRAAVLLLPGAIRADSTETLPKGTMLLGQTGVTVAASNASGNVDDSTFVTAFGAIASTTTLAADIVEGSTQVHLTAAVAVNNFIRVKLAGTALFSVFKVLAFGAGIATVDRPVQYPFVNTNVVEEYAPSEVPSDIYIIGGGMRVTGTAPAYVNMFGCRDFIVSGLRFLESGGIPPTPADAIASINIGSYNGAFIDLRGDMKGIALNTGFGMLGEATSLVRCNAMNLLNGSAIKVVNSLDWQVSSCFGSGSNFGLAVVTDVGLGIPNKRGGVLGGAFNGNATNGVLIVNAKRLCFAGTAADYNGAEGWMLDGTSAEISGLMLNGCFGRRNVGQAMRIKGAAQSPAIEGFDGSESAGAIIANDAFVARGVRYTAKAGSAAAAIDLTAGAAPYVAQIDASAITVNANAFAVHANGNASVTSSNNSLTAGAGGACIITDVASTGVVRVSSTVGSAGAGGKGLVTQGTSTARVGLSNDFSACPTPTQFVAGSFGSQGTAVLPGGAGNHIDVAWPDLKSTDRVRMIASVLAGTPGVLSIAYTPGTGFRISSSDALDTSSIEWSIVA